MPITLQHFYMIRHGETDANAARIMAGSLDSPLNDKGLQQAKDAQAIVENLKIKPQTIIHSNLTRARITAKILNENLNLPIYEDADVAEWHAGDWEGIPYENCSDFLNGWETPPNGEKASDFLKRIRNFKNRTLQKPDQPVMIVSHGGVFRAFGKLYGFESQGVANCVLYEFTPNPSKSQLPWDIWEYKNENDPIKEPAMIYSAPNASAAKIA